MRLNWYGSTYSRRYLDFARARPRLSRSLGLTNRQNTHNFAERICFAEHGKLVAESSVHFFQFEILKKKWDILSEKRESGMAL